VHFLAAARGQDVLAAARVIQRGGTICVVDVDGRGADGTTVARALVTYKLG
jgi:acyl-coenzyme A thioesterase PaaI-like protein